MSGPVGAGRDGSGCAAGTDPRVSGLPSHALMARCFARLASASGLLTFETKLECHASAASFPIIFFSPSWATPAARIRISFGAVSSTNKVPTFALSLAALRCPGTATGIKSSDIPRAAMAPCLPASCGDPLFFAPYKFSTAVSPKPCTYSVLDWMPALASMSLANAPSHDGLVIVDSAFFVPCLPNSFTSK